MTQDEAIIIGQGCAVADWRGGYRTPCSYDTALGLVRPHVGGPRDSMAVHVAAEEYLAAFSLLSTNGRFAGMERHA